MLMEGSGSFPSPHTPAPPLPWLTPGRKGKGPPTCSGKYCGFLVCASHLTGRHAQLHQGTSLRGSQLVCICCCRRTLGTLLRSHHSACLLQSLPRRSRAADRCRHYPKVPSGTFPCGCFPREARPDTRPEALAPVGQAWAGEGPPALVKKHAGFAHGVRTCAPPLSNV